MTRVLMTTDAVGGVWSYSLELCRALKAHGYEVVLACLGGPLRPEARAEAQSLRVAASRSSWSSVSPLRSITA